jgi:hypothetical protein
MRPAPEPSSLRVELAPFPERIAQYPKAPPPAWTNDGERRPPPWSAGGPALLPECLLPTPLRAITTVSVAPDGTVAIGGPDGLAAWEHGRWRYYAGQRCLPSNEVRPARSRPRAAPPPHPVRVTPPSCLGKTMRSRWARPNASERAQTALRLGHRLLEGCDTPSQCLLPEQRIVQCLPQLVLPPARQPVSDQRRTIELELLDVEAARFGQTGQGAVRLLGEVSGEIVLERMEDPLRRVGRPDVAFVSVAGKAGVNPVRRFVRPVPRTRMVMVDGQLRSDIVFTDAAVAAAKIEAASEDHAFFRAHQPPGGIVTGSPSPRPVTFRYRSRQFRRRSSISAILACTSAR